MPSVQSAAKQWKAKFPEQAAFLDSADFAAGMPSAVGATDVIADFDAKLEALQSTDPKTLLDAVQTSFQATLSAKS